jgi:iron complex outermembrane receptor protein
MGHLIRDTCADVFCGTSRTRFISALGAISIFCAAGSTIWAQSTNEPVKAISELKKLSLEELFDAEITTVSKRPERLVDAPSAIQLITSEDIRRSGATSLPEALRLAPNLQVAQIDSRQFAITARGFNTTTTDKLLVLIDGRTVYTPLFSGVFWDAQNVMLEDIDRIEVISGPGAALWGANAVNGVINVISKSAKDTQGLLVTGGAGSYLKGFGSLRYGDKLGKDVYFRLYGMGFARNTASLPNGVDGGNDWALGQGGFRGDWLPAQGDTLTVQGDVYSGDIDQRTPGQVAIDGQNILSRWVHPLADDSDFTIQAYWDRTWRRVPNVFSEQLNTYDIDGQYRRSIGDRNKFLAGLGYRLMADEVGNSAVIGFLPGERSLQLFSAFAQDEIEIVEDKMALTLGSKFEHNDFSGFEVQPSARVAYTPIKNQTIWGSVSRAVRSPSRIDTDLVVPGNSPYSIVGGGDQFKSETVVAYELGYHTQITRKIGVSAATFYNDYDDIRSVEPGGAGAPNVIRNQLSAETYGVELSGIWRPFESWRLRGGYTIFKKHIDLDESLDVNQGRSEGNDPHHQFLIQSMVNLPANMEFDATLRFVDDLNQLGPVVPSYFALDLRLAWHPTPNWEIALVGQNLLDNSHPEFGAPASRQEIPRSVYGKVTFKY